MRKNSRQYPVPTYVVEFLLGRYCVSTDPAEIEEGLQIVEKQLQGRTVRTGEEELFKARSRDQGSVKIIDIVRARLDTRSDSYMAEVPSLAIKDAQIDDELVRANERMLTDSQCLLPSARAARWASKTSTPAPNPWLATVIPAAMNTRFSCVPWTTTAVAPA